MRRFFLFGIILIFHSTPAFADITLTAGEWSTTFNCGDWTQTDGVSTVNVNCDGLKGLSTSWFCEGTEETEITAAANYSGGGGGSGLRFRYGDNDGSTAQVASGSTGMSITFAGGAVDEFWMRFYVRFASGFQQDRALYHKYLYLSDSFGGNGRYIDTNAANDEIRIGNSLQQLGTYAFDDFYGATSDGSWHCIEFHLSVSGTTAEYWVDGVQRGSIANADWGAMTGFAIVNFLQNMKNLYDTDDCWTVDVDDIAVSTNGYIGPVGEDTTAPEVSVVNVDEDGETVTFTFTEPTSQGAGYNDSDVDLDCSTTGNDISLTYVSGDDSASHVYTAGSTIQNGETCDFDFNGDANSLEDGAGNDLAAIVSGDVTNGSQQGIATSSGHVASYSSSGQSGEFSPYGHIVIDGTTIPDNYFSDNFNRGDGALTSPWFGQGLSIATNKLEPTTDEGEVSYYNALIPDDHFSGFTITDYGTTTYAVLRGDQDPPAEGHQNCYLFRILAGQTGTRGWSLIRVASGVGATLDSGTVDIGGGDDEVFAVVQGSNPVVIWCVVNGTILSRYEDSAGNRILSGYPGVALTDAAGGGAVDNFYCGNINQLYKVVSWTLN